MKFKRTKGLINFDEEKQKAEKKKQDVGKEERKQQKETEKKEGTLWATKIIKKFGGILPTITHLTRGARRKKIQFWCYESLDDAAEFIVEREKRFRTKTNVHTAAHYNGMMLLLEKYKNRVPEFQNSRFTYFYNSLKASEELNSSLCAIDDFTKQVVLFKKSFEKNLISDKEFDKKCKWLTSTLPKNLQKLAREKIKRIIAGEKVFELFETVRYKGEGK